VTQLALVIDLNVCVGCHACVTSCKQWNTSGSAGPLADFNPYDRDPTGTFFNRVQTFEVGAYHRGQGLGDDAFAGEIGDGDRQAVGAGTGNLHRELGIGKERRGCQTGGDEQRVEFHGLNYSGLVPYGSVGNIQQTIKNVTLLGLWQRAGLQDRAFNSRIERGIPGRFFHLDVDNLSAG